MYAINQHTWPIVIRPFKKLEFLRWVPFSRRGSGIRKSSTYVDMLPDHLRRDIGLVPKSNIGAHRKTDPFFSLRF